MPLKFYQFDDWDRSCQYLNRLHGEQQSIVFSALASCSKGPQFETYPLTLDLAKGSRIQILNKSTSDGDTFYLYVYHIGNKKHSMRLSTRHENCSISFMIQTIPVKQSKIPYDRLPFHISIAVAEKYLLEPAEGLEEGYKKLSIKVKLIE